MTLPLSSPEAVKQHVANLHPSFMGRVLFRCGIFRKKIVMDNIARVFNGILSVTEQKKLAEAFYSHLFQSIWEIIRSRFQSTATIAQQITIIGKEYLFAAAASGKGALLLSGHLGNWEVAPIAAMLNVQEYRDKFYVVRKTLGIKWLERMVFRRFFAAGLQVIPKKNSLEKICLALEQNNMVIYIFDQHASIKSKDGLAVDFFGHKAGTYRALAMIAENTGAAVIPTMYYRRQDGHHVMEFFPPVEWIADDDYKQALLLNTQHYNHVMEKMILLHPEQWLWLHRRWKLTEEVVTGGYS